MSSQELQFEELIEGILANNYAICDDFLSPDQVQNLLKTFTHRYNDGKFKQAGIGKTDEVQMASHIRGDEILWLESNSTDSAERAVLDKNQAFVNYLNKTCYLGIKNTEVHFAKYGVGRYYRRHRDTFKAKSGRILSVIYYLNQNWVPENGGNLIIYSQKNNCETPVIIAPLAGRLVCFESEKLDHEVTETFAERFSVTGWLINNSE